MAHVNRQLTIKPNLLFRYRPASTWCRHGLILTLMSSDRLVAVDTYWRDPEHGESSLDDLDNLEFVADLDGFRRAGREECQRYLDADVVFIPSGATSAEWWIRKDAQPNKQQIMDQLNRKISEKEYVIKSATRDLEQLRKELTEAADDRPQL